MHETISTHALTVGSILLKVALPVTVPLVMLSQAMVTEQTGVPLTILASVAGACWYLNGRLTTLENQIKEMRHNMQKFQCHKNGEPCDSHKHQ